LEQVLYLPIESVFSNDSVSFVYFSGGKKIRQIIEAGDKNENYVVIKQGLTEGQDVLLNEPDGAEDFELTGMEIYANILKKREEEKAKKAEEEKLLKQKEAEQLQNMPVAMPAGGVVMIK